MSTDSFSLVEIIERVDSKEILLPSMQRKFVWKEEKIIDLFDSVLRGYPFGIFLFWHIKTREEINKYHFYEFIKDYSAKESTINSKAGRIIKSNIDVVMDGQQRLTAFYIGLKGSLTNIDKYKKKNIAENWKKKKLYIKPYTSQEDKNEDEPPYRFVFLEDSFVEEWNANHNDYDKYYLVADLYGLSKGELYAKMGVKRIRTKDDNWRYILEKLRMHINDSSIINVHTIKNTNIVDVLEIFKRINNGGTELSPANLMFSTVITSWEDGREKMDEFIRSINDEGVMQLSEGFLIRTCLYLLNKPSSGKIEILTKDTVKSIKSNWEKIKQAIIRTKNYLKKRNIYKDAIVSNNAIMPIIYFFYHDSSRSKATIDKSEQQLFYYFSISQMFSLFGGSSSSTLDAVRKGLCKDFDKKPGRLRVPFKIENLFDINLSAGRIHAFKIEKEQIVKLVDSVHYGEQKAFCLLCLLQPNIIVKSGEYDVDHVCSKNELKMVSRYQKGKERQELDKKKDLISNLQLLDYRQNREDKNADTLYTWVVEKKNSIPFDPYENDNKVKYKIESMNDFLVFYDERRNKIVSYLCDCFGVSEEK